MRRRAQPHFLRPQSDAAIVTIFSNVPERDANGHGGGIDFPKLTEDISMTRRATQISGRRKLGAFHEESG
jgi:hypothetical protein